MGVTIDVGVAFVVGVAVDCCVGVTMGSGVVLSLAVDVVADALLAVGDGEGSGDDPQAANAAAASVTPARDARTEEVL